VDGASRCIFMLTACSLTIARADYKQAVAYYMQGRYDKAIQELKPDLDQNPDWEIGHRLVGLCYLNLKTTPWLFPPSRERSS